MLHIARVGFFLASVLPLSISADIKLPGGVPPQVEPLSARVLRGGEVAVELRGHYGGAGAVVFRIVRPPRYGKLSGLHTISGNRAAITYTQDAKHTEKLDSFAYFIQAGGRASSPAEVQIQVDDPPAQLQTINELDFGEIQAGQSALRELPITNSGGGILAGKITVSNPWRIAPTEFRVESGKTEIVRLAFEPDEAKAFVGQVTLSHENGKTQTVSLAGMATPALQVSPTTLLFAGQPRKETVSMTNLTDAPMELTFATGEHLQPIRGITLAANQTRNVDVEVRPNVTGPIQDSMLINGPRFRTQVTIEIPPLPTLAATATATPVALASVGPSAVAERAAHPPTSAPLAPAVHEGADATPLPEEIPLLKVIARRLNAADWELRWPSESPRAASYRVEERSLSLDRADALQTEWRSLPASVISGRDPVFIKARNLDKNHAHVLRVTAFNTDGTALWESPPIALAALPITSHARTLWLIGSSFALIGFLFLRWRAR